MDNFQFYNYSQTKQKMITINNNNNNKKVLLLLVLVLVIASVKGQWSYIDHDYEFRAAGVSFYNDTAGWMAGMKYYGYDPLLLQFCFFFTLNLFFYYLLNNFFY